MATETDVIHMCFLSNKVSVLFCSVQDDFYSALDSITTRYSSSAIFLIAGDFNSKLGKKLTNERPIGEHSSGIRNANGTALDGFLLMMNVYSNCMLN